MLSRDRLFVSINVDDPGALTMRLKALTPHVGGIRIGPVTLNALGLIPTLNTVRHHMHRRSDCVFVDAAYYGAPGDVSACVAQATVNGMTRFVSVNFAAGPDGLEAAAAHQAQAAALVTTAPAWLDEKKLAWVYGRDQHSNLRDNARHAGYFSLSAVMAAGEAGCRGAIVPAAHVEMVKMRTSFDQFTLLVPDAVAPWSDRKTDVPATPYHLMQYGADVIVLQDDDLMNAPRRIGSPEAAVRAIIADIDKAFPA